MKINTTVVLFCSLFSLIGCPGDEFVPYASNFVSVETSTVVDQQNSAFDVQVTLEHRAVFGQPPSSHDISAGEVLLVRQGDREQSLGRRAPGVYGTHVDGMNYDPVSLELYRREAPNALDSSIVFRAAPTLLFADEDLVFASGSTIRVPWHLKGVADSATSKLTSRGKVFADVVELGCDPDAFRSDSQAVLSRFAAETTRGDDGVYWSEIQLSKVEDVADEVSNRQEESRSCSAKLRLAIVDKVPASRNGHAFQDTNIISVVIDDSFRELEESLHSSEFLTITFDVAFERSND